MSASERPLRVGIRAGHQLPTEGGGFTIISAVCNALREMNTLDTLVWLDEPGVEVAAAPETVSIEREASNSTAAAPRPSGFAALTSKLRRRTAIPPIEKVEAAVPAVPAAAPDETAIWNGIAKRNKLDLLWFLHPPGLPLNLPYIVTVWDLEHRKQPYFPEVSVTGWVWEKREADYRASLPRATFVITGTDAGRREIETFYGVNADRIRIFPFPAPGPAERCEGIPNPRILAECNTETKFLFYPAQFWPHKNHVNLLHALRIVLDKGHQLKLVLTGIDNGNKTYVDEVKGQLDLDRHIVDLGFVDRSSIDALYKDAVALVYPSFFGPDNLPPLEAFAAGCPVIAADVPGAREQLGPAAEFCDPASPADIASKIIAVCENEALRDALIIEGKKITASRSGAHYAANFQSMLDDFRNIRRCWGAEYKHA